MHRSNSVSSQSSLSSNSSATSTRSGSIESESNIQIFVKNVSGDTFPLRIPESTTIFTLQSLLALRTNLPEAHLRLVHAGKHLSATKSTLSDYSIRDNTTLHLALPLRGGAKPRCAFIGCKQFLSPSNEACACDGQFCWKHHIPELHQCPKLEQMKETEKERNAKQLLAEATTSSVIPAM